VKWLLLIIGGLLSLTLGFSIIRGLPVIDILPLMLVLLLSAIPVALPVMFTVSMAFGARDLARHNVLITRLGATEDAATMDVLCVDKTGTLTLNEMAVSRIIPLGSFSENDVILYGALASHEANQDSLDLAFIKLAKERKILNPSYTQESFVPFDPLLRKTEALVRHDHKTFRVMKGALSAIAQACGLASKELQDLEARIQDFSKKGYKTLAVAVIENSKPVVAGLAALSDRPRPGRMLSRVILVDVLVGIMISAWGIPGALQRIPLPMTALVIGFNILFSLFLNDSVKIRLLKELRLV
jgi:H+-transporting ATPase